jgi:hypothetical protein
MTRSTTIASSLLLILASACAEGLGDDDLDFGAGDGDGAADEDSDGDEDDAGDTGEEDDGDSEYDPPEGEEHDCGSFATSVDELPPNVMLVLDKSGSMVRDSNKWDHDGDADTADVTRWNSLYQVVSGIFGSFDEGMRFGATLFPSMEADMDDIGTICLVSDSSEVPVGDDTAEDILGAIPGAEENDFGGATPAAEGIQTAVESLLATDHDGPKVMVLVTDGAANCVPEHEQEYKLFDERLITNIADAHASGIPTYVVGIDIELEQAEGEIDTFTKLNEAAQAGGVARDGEEAFYNAQSHTELQTALDSITAEVECMVEAPVMPSVSWLIDVTVGNQEFNRVTDCETEDGWMLNGKTYSLCGSACDLYAAGETFEVHYGCPEEG